MSKRRARHDGGLHLRADGIWEATLDLGIGDAGKRRRRSVYGRTKTIALEKLREAREDAGLGLRAGGRKQRLADYVTTWLEQRDPRIPTAGVRKLGWNTWASYEARMRLHVFPSIGAKQLGAVEPDDIRRMLTAAAGKGLGQTTVAMVRDTLATILERAVKDRSLPYNPVHAVDSVGRAKPRTYVVTADAAKRLLAAAHGDAFEAAIALAVYAGLRESEVFGLQWQDVNLENGTLTVRQALHRVRGFGLQPSAPKTAASAATIPLSTATSTALRAHRARQAGQMLAAGRPDGWNADGYVFTTEEGTPVSASNFYRRHFVPIAKAAGLPAGRQPDGSSGVTFHGLRHACGSLLISLGVAPKHVQTILRHSKLSTTMDLYVHAYDEDLRGAAAKLDRALA